MQSVEAEVVDAGEKGDGRGRRFTPAEQRAKVVQAYRASGLTAAAFARREGLKYQTFAGWVARSMRDSQCAPRVGFAQVSLLATSASLSSSLEVQLADGTVVRGREASAVAELVRALRA